MSISMYSASVPVFVHMLEGVALWLDKAEAHAAAKKFDPSVYLGLRLAPDMLPFKNQIQIASDAAKFGVARLAGIEAQMARSKSEHYLILGARSQLKAARRQYVCLIKPIGGGLGLRRAEVRPCRCRIFGTIEVFGMQCRIMIGECGSGLQMQCPLRFPR